MAWLHTLLWLAVACISAGWVTRCCAAREKRGGFCTCATGRAGEKWARFLKGLLTNLANPKAIIYFGRCSHCLSVITLALPRAGAFFADHCRNTGVVYRRCQPVCPAQMRRGYQRLAKWIDGFAGAYLPDLAFI